MFDLITGRATHLPRNQSLPLVVSMAGQVTMVGLVIVLPLLWVTDQLPEMPTMMAFVAAPPVPPPPPPPPAPVAEARKAPSPPATPPAPGQLVAPIEAPRTIVAETARGVDDGVAGGVEGGIPGGVVGGVVGGLPEALPPPPPPAPAPARPAGPVRLGGQLQTPALVRRVEPNYPPFLVNARIHGVVILEAVVNDEGAVTDVKVLRSVNALLDHEAMLAVRQWRYSPLLLDGIRVPFVLTVTLSFSVQEAAS